jgi:hypothetical protein
MADDILKKAEAGLTRIHAVEPGDVLGITSGTKMSSGSTNLMRLHVVGHQERPKG